MPEIGDELAVSRALHDLAANLRGIATDEIDAATNDASHGW